MKVVKKVSLSALMVVMVLALGFGSFVPRAKALATGDLVKGPNSDAVYYINGTMKHVFPDKKTYMTWYTNFDAVKTVTVAELDGFSTGAPVAYRSGTKLVTHPNTARVYAVEPGGKLRWITDEATATALYGSMWAKSVNDVHELTFGNYTVGSDMTSGAPAAGTILKKTGESTIYYYDGTNIKPFASSAAFDANNLNAAFIVEFASLGSWTVGSSITGAESFANISGTGVGQVVTGPAGSLTVSLSPNTAPANQVLLGGAARVPLTTVRMTAGSTDVVVDSVTIERKGIASDAAFSDFDLLRGDTGLPLNNTSKSLNSSHQAVFNDDFTVPANAGWDVVIAANMAASLASYAGEYPVMALVTVVLKNNSTLSGTLPIMGNVALTNGTITVGTARVGTGSNNPSATTKEVGTKDYIVSSFKINNNSSESVHTMTLRSLTLTQNGSAAAEDLENVRLRDTNAGTVLATVAKPTAKKIHFTGLNKDILKGNTLNLDVLVDIKGGSARTISLDIDQKSDIVIWDVLRSANVLPSYFSDASYATAVTASPFYNPADTTVGNGKLRIESVAVTPTNIAENKTGVLLGKFKFVMEGEIGNITALGLKVATTTGGTLTSALVVGDLTNLTVKNPAGQTVAGPQDIAANQANNGFTATTTDTVSVPVGETIYSVYGDLSSDWTANDRIQVGIFPGAVTMKGDVTGNTITPTPTGQIQSTLLTIKSADLNVSVSASPAAQTVVAGAPDFEVANIVMDASESGADVRVTSLLVPIITTGSAYPDIVSGLQLFVGSTEVPVASRSTTYSGTGSTAAGSGTTTLTITAGNLTVVAGQSKTVRVVGDVGTGATSGTFKLGIQAGGITTIDSEAQSFTADITAGQGQAMTLASGGTLNVAVAQDPKAALVVGGTTVNVGQFTAQAKNEGMTLASFGFNIGNPDNHINVTNDFYQVEQLEVWESGGSSALGTIAVSAAASTVTPSSPLSLAINEQKTFIVKAKFKTVVSPSVALSNTGMAVTMTNIDATGTSAGSSSVTRSGLNTAFKTFTSYRSLPSVTYQTLTADQIVSASSEVDLFKFAIAASTDYVGVAKFTFGVATSTSVKLSTTGFKLYESSSSSSLGNQLSGTTDFVVTQVIPANLAAALHVEARFDVNNDDAAVAEMGDHLVINPNTTRYFTLKGTLTANSATANDDSISTVLGGDETGVTVANTNFGTLDATAADDFIWSDLNFDLYATSTATQTYGWWNGYRVSGLDDASSTPQTQTD